MKRSIIVCLIAIVSLSYTQQIQCEEKSDEKFNSSWQSLEHYRCPDWFKDAKFGIWTYWNPYTVPAQGDWYARNMYIEGSKHCKYHVANYGHPSRVDSGYFRRMAELTAQDFRFTTRGSTVYAFICGKPTTKTVAIHTFSTKKYHAIKSINMLGVEGNLSFEQKDDALYVSLPESLPCDYSVCLKIIPTLNPVPKSLVGY
jgi:hypothetical protein